MDIRGPIMIIEDDLDDQFMFQEVFNSLKYENEVIYFEDGISALKHLTESAVKPFIIFSDINMPKLSGIELRERIHQNEDLRLKSIPYLFFSTTAEQRFVIDAYSKSAQGFFVKPMNFEELKDTIEVILKYWQKCVAPKYVK
jgi:CheY-like chemotaxis protein